MVRLLILAIAAVMAVLLALLLFHVSDAGSTADLQTASIAPTGTAMATLAPTYTAKPSPTPAPTRRPVVIPTATPRPHPLPAPAKNPPPPAPPKKTPTPVPAPSPTPCSSATPCPTETPAPCTANGPPYYVTPTATPTNATIAQAITAAATRNGIEVLVQEAIAWQESGWQQNIVACDGGIGLMQLMPATVQWLNQYYGVNDDPYQLDGNAGLGAGYIAYYYRFYTGYVEQNYPGYCPQSGCDWNTVWPGDTSSTTILDIVISVYNEGAGTMSTQGIINWWYVDDVLSYMNASPPPWG
jgi:hypothetical protein